MVATLVLGTNVERRVGSSPSFGTKYQCGVTVAAVVSKATLERGVGSIPTTDTNGKHKSIN